MPAHTKVRILRTHHWYVTPRFEIGKIWEIERVTSNFRLLPASLVSAVPAVFSQQQSDRAVEVAAGAAVDPSLPPRHLLINRVQPISNQALVRKGKNQRSYSPLVIHINENIEEFLEKKKTPEREAWS